MPPLIHTKMSYFKPAFTLGLTATLVVHEFQADRITGDAEAYPFLGTANYVQHEGSRPMNIP